MKNSIKLTFLLLIIIGNVLSAQNRQLQRWTEMFVENANTYDTRNFYDENAPQNYDGNPYYKTKFLPGEIYLENELLDNDVLLRYNAVSDEIEFKDTQDNDQIKALVKSKDLYVKIDGEVFAFIPSHGYFLAIQDGKNFSLLKKVFKKYYPPKEAKNTYDKGSIAKFTDKQSYFIYSKDGVLKEFPKSKKKKMKIFGNSEKLMKEYISKNNIDISTEKGLKAAIIYLDSVEGAKL